MHTKNVFLTIASTAIAISVLFSSQAFSAGVMLQPLAASTNMGFFNSSSQYDPSNTINQSGLTANYVSGVTDFDSFVTSTTTDSGGSGNRIWYADTGNVTGNFDFDLGGTFTIDSFALWADPQGIGQSVNSFNLLADDNAAFSSATLLGSFAAADGPSSGTASEKNANNFGQVFSFAPTAASHVRIEILSNHGSTFTTGISEAAFGVSVVPVPAAAWLFGSALGLLGWARRKTA